MTVLDTTLIPTSVTLRPNIDTREFKIPVQRRAEEFIIQDPSRTHLKQPIGVIVELTKSGQWVAYHPVIRTHGYGRSDVEAVKDFHYMMIGLFLELVDSEDELALHLRKELDYLREIIIEDSIK